MLVMSEKAYLTNDTIAEWTDKGRKIYENKIGKKRKPDPSVHLGIEETLLRFRDCYGTESMCSI